MNITRINVFLCSVFFLLSAGSPLICTATEPAAVGRVEYVATIHPLAEIIRKVAGNRGTVTQLLPPGSSPHTFAPRPSLIRKTAAARAFFYVGPGLDKEWVSRLPAVRKIEVIDLIPPEFRLPVTGTHLHGEKKAAAVVAVNPHFWLDPLTVRAILPRLTEILATLDANGRRVYEANSAAFADELTALHQELIETLKPVSSMPIFVFHPSFQYLIKRYQLSFAGVINPFPGWESTPKTLFDLQKKIRQAGAKAIFSEVQLPRAAADNLAEAASTKAVKIKVYELDPLGGGKGRESYAQLLRYNARILRAAAR